jgi:hypothetical protein
MWRTAVMALLSVFIARAEPEPRRFLLVIDTSQSMDARKGSVIKTVRGLIRSGFGGQIMTGDTIDLWTFASDLRVDRFPTQYWEPQRAPLLSEIAAQFLASEMFQGRTFFKNISTPVNTWIDNQPEALLFFITDGEDPVMGVPKDIEINDFIGEGRRHARAAKRVFLISMLVRNGWVTEWRGHDGIGKVELPLLPVREPELPPVVAEEPKTPEPAVSEPPLPVIELPPGARVVTVEPSSPAPEIAAPVATPEPPAAIVKEPEPLAVEEESSVNSALPEPPPEMVEKVVVPEPVATPPPLGAVAPVSRKSVYFAIGAGVLLTMIAFFLFFRRRRSGGASLISKSLWDK